MTDAHRVLADWLLERGDDYPASLITASMEAGCDDGCDEGLVLAYAHHPEARPLCAAADPALVRVLEETPLRAMRRLGEGILPRELRLWLTLYPQGRALVVAPSQRQVEMLDRPLQQLEWVRTSRTQPCLWTKDHGRIYAISTAARVHSIVGIGYDSAFLAANVTDVPEDLLERIVAQVLGPLP